MRLDVQRRVGSAMLTLVALQVFASFAATVGRRCAGVVMAQVWRAARMQYATVMALAADMPLTDDEMEAGLEFLRDIEQSDGWGDDEED